MEKELNTIKAYYINPKTDTACECDIVDSLDVFYDMLDCGTIDIVNRGFSNSKKRFDIICDDEGLLKDEPYVSAVDTRGSAMLVGALLVVGEADDEGNLTSLSGKDIEFLKRRTMSLPTRRHDAHSMLVCMTY
jgi:hypothetical protein